MADKCGDKDKNDLLINFALEFDHSFFYAFFLQIILIFYMYFTVGHGKYWRVLFIGSILGFFGALMEHTFIAIQNTYYLDDDGRKKDTKWSILLLFAEVGWICSEFAVPVLNLIKLNSVTHHTIIKYLNIVTTLLFCVFTLFRSLIGYSRYNESKVDCHYCDEYHAAAFGVMAVTDTVLSIMIYVKINKTSNSYRNKRENENASLLTTFKRSSVFTLLIVDVISVFLSLTYILPLFCSTSDYAKPFHSLKNNFLLILAVDAFVFKFKANRNVSCSASNLNRSSSGGVNSNSKHSTRKFKRSSSYNNELNKAFTALRSTNPTISNTTSVVNNKTISHSPLINHNQIAVSSPLMTTSAMGPHSPIIAHNAMGSYNPIISHNVLGAHSPLLTNNKSHFNVTYSQTPNKVSIVKGNSSTNAMQNYRVSTVSPIQSMSKKQFSLYTTKDTKINIEAQENNDESPIPKASNNEKRKSVNSEKRKSVNSEKRKSVNSEKRKSGVERSPRTSSLIKIRNSQISPNWKAIYMDGIPEMDYGTEKNT